MTAPVPTKIISKVCSELGITYSISPVLSWGTTFYVLRFSKPVVRYYSGAWRDYRPEASKFFDANTCVAQICLDLSHVESRTGNFLGYRYSSNQLYTVVQG